MRNNIQKVKDRLAKLLNLTEENGASKGEVDNALKIATQLMAKHQLSREDIDLENASDPTKNVKFDRVSVFTLSAKMFRWELDLLWFVSNFIGSVKFYSTRGAFIARQNGVALLNPKGEPRKGRKSFFYGPEEDCEATAELYNELQQAIQTMGIVRFGGWAKGDGGAYCEGFVEGLESAREKAMQQLEQGDEQTAALMVLSEKTQLAIQSASKNWLSTECGVNLVKGSGLGGSQSGSGQARGEGRADGKKYNPNRPSGTKKIG